MSGSESRAGADLSNWQAAPWNRWAFQHTAELIPCATIGTPSPGAAPLPSAPAALDGFALPRAAGASLDLDGFLQATATDALVVLRDGAVVFEHYGEDAAPERPHILMSASKAVTGLVAGVLEARGALDPAAPVTRYVPEVADGPYAGATVRQLLDMRTGVRLDAEGERAYLAATGWSPPDDPPRGLHAVLAGLRGAAATPHGGPFAYVSANTDLLGWAIERAAGRPFAELVGELLWRPMGGQDAALITLDPAGAPRCTGGVCATARDLARLGQVVAEGGRDVLPAGLVDDLAHGGDRAAWAEGEWAAFSTLIGGPMAFRSGWYAVDSEPGWLFAMGIHGQNLFVDRANRIVIAKLSSWAERIDFGLLALTHKGVDELRRVLLAG